MSKPRSKRKHGGQAHTQLTVSVPAGVSPEEAIQAEVDAYVKDHLATLLAEALSSAATPSGQGTPTQATQADGKAMPEAPDALAFDDADDDSETDADDFAAADAEVDAAADVLAETEAEDEAYAHDGEDNDDTLEEEQYMFGADWDGLGGGDDDDFAGDDDNDDA